MTTNGFVDLQVNGYKGVNFNSPDLTVEDIHRTTRALACAGTIAYCPTLPTGNGAICERNLRLFARAMEDREWGGHILGIHLEGPFISPLEGARGAHPPKHIRNPDIKFLERLQECADGHIAILTLAPETPGALSLIRQAIKAGIRVSMGHHLADDDAMKKAVKAGATASTHLGNGLPNMINRHQNPLWWQLACDDIYGMFITDGHHLPADFIKVALRAKTTGRFIVVSDSVHIAGLPPGNYTFLDDKVVLAPNGRISFADTPYLAGSSANMIQCMNHLGELKLLSERNLWQVGRENPLCFLGRNETTLARLKGARVEFRNNKFSVKA